MQKLTSPAPFTRSRRSSREFLLLFYFPTSSAYSLAVGICNKLKDGTDESPSETTMDWLYLIIAVIPLACESLGIIPVLSILLGELFPTDIRSISVGIVRAVAYTISYCNMMVYPIVSGAGAFSEMMFGYGAISAFMTAWAIFTVKETDNMSLVEIENSFRKLKEIPGDTATIANMDSCLKLPEQKESAPLLKK